MDRLLIYKAAMIVVPILSGLVGSGVIAYEVGRLHHLKAEQAHTAAQVVELNRQIENTRGPGPGSRYPAVEQSVDEQPQFLNTLRSYADSAHVQIVRWTNVPAPPPPVTPDGKAKQTLPANASAIISTVEIKGHYNDARRFLYEVLYCPRLFAMNDVKWARGDKWPDTQVTFTLTRYVMLPKKA